MDNSLNYVKEIFLLYSASFEARFPVVAFACGTPVITSNVTACLKLLLMLYI
jgi:hypothetical protein